MLRPLALAWLALVAVAGAAQPTVAVSGQVRHRSEHDARDGATDPVQLHLLRTRLGVTVQPQPHVRAVVQVQDARLFGSEDPALGRGTLDGSADGLDLHQAYLALDSVAGTGLGVAVGRQELAYGNERLIGAVGWSNVGRSFDAVRLRLRQGALTADAFVAQLAGPLATRGAEHVAGVYATHPVAPGHAVDAFAVYDAAARLAGGPDAGARRLARLTPGMRAHGAAGRLDYDLELIGQGGQRAPSDSAARQTVAAFLVSAAGGWRPTPAVRVGAGYTHLSGDSRPADGTHRTFDTLFATNHAFYGTMDYFPGLIPAAGLQDAWLSLGVRVGGVQTSLDVHRFVPAAGGGGPLGHEVDLAALYRSGPAFALTGGVSVFVPGGSLREAGREQTTHWLFLQTQVTF